MKQQSEHVGEREHVLTKVPEHVLDQPHREASVLRRHLVLNGDQRSCSVILRKRLSLSSVAKEKPIFDTSTAFLYTHVVSCSIGKVAHPCAKSM